MKKDKIFIKIGANLLTKNAGGNIYLIIHFNNLYIELHI